MKKIISLALAAGLLVGASVEAKAADVSVFGLLSNVAHIEQNSAFGADQDLDPSFHVQSRAEFGMRIKASETISGQFRLRVPNIQIWGVTADSYAGNTSVNVDPAVRVREAFIKLPVAMFDVTAGYQFHGLPKVASGVNPIDAGFNPMPGIKATADFGMVTPTFAWVAVNDYNIKSNVYYAMAPVALADGMKLTPWVSFNETQGGSYISGDDTIFSEPRKDSTVYMGASFDAVINNMTAGAGAIYLMDDNEDNDASMAVAANFAINLGSLTPGIAVWYGMEGDSPISYEYEGNTTACWAGFNGSQTAMGYMMNSHSGMAGSNLHAAMDLTPFNTLAVVANVANIRAVGGFIEANVAYMMGTSDYGDNDVDAGVEVNASYYLPLAQGVHFGLALNYAMPLVDAYGAGFGVATRLAMNF